MEYINIDYGIEEYLLLNKYEYKDNIFRIITKNRNSVYMSNLNKKDIIVNVNHLNEDVVVGDFVEAILYENEYYIKEILNRSTVLSKAYNKTKKSYAYNASEQILASNIDQIFIIIAADQRFTISKLERYLMTFSNMAQELNIVISKSDHKYLTCKIYEEIRSIYPNIKINTISIFDEESMKKIQKIFKPNKTSILLGSSGAGKSTLINYLIGDDFIETQEVKKDKKGKHTTTSSSLYYMKSTKSYIIDTPGFKAISTNRKSDENILFSEIFELSKHCKFNDCKHETEPGCAVKEAIKNDEALRKKYERYLQIQYKNERYEKFLEKKLKNK